MSERLIDELHNGYQMMFNLLLTSIAAYSPEVVDSWCDLVEDLLQNEPKIPPVTRSVMERLSAGMRAQLRGEEGGGMH